MAAVLLPVRVVPAEAWLRARGQVERSCEVFEVHAVREVDTDAVVFPLACATVVCAIS